MKKVILKKKEDREDVIEISEDSIVKMDFGGSIIGMGLDIRNGGQFFKRAIFLPDEVIDKTGKYHMVEWVVGKDDAGCNVLIPVKADTKL